VTGRGAAPGRVNLIGEHTDYNDGFVLPMAIPQQTRVALVARSDDRVVARTDAPGQEPATYRLGEESPGAGWIDYVQGATAALRERGLRVPGFDAAVTSDVPVGSGLSSSAALGIALQRALRELAGLALDDWDLVHLAHQAESRFVGVPVGLLDPIACSFATTREALFVDTRNLAVEKVGLPSGIAVMVIDSGQRHALGSSDYRVRRAECEEAARRLGVASLRDVSIGELDRVSALPEPLDRRARHVVTENARVLRAVDAMRRDDPVALGQAFDASHASMRDDYQCSTPEIDRLVEIARSRDGVSGARLTGGGWGGAIVVLASAGAAAEVGRSVVEEAGSVPSLHPRVLVGSA
jgi:galactokinase